MLACLCFDVPQCGFKWDTPTVQLISSQNLFQFYEMVKHFKIFDCTILGLRLRSRNPINMYLCFLSKFATYVRIYVVKCLWCVFGRGCIKPTESQHCEHWLSLSNSSSGFLGKASVRVDLNAQVLLFWCADSVHTQVKSDLKRPLK